MYRQSPAFMYALRGFLIAEGQRRFIIDHCELDKNRLRVPTTAKTCLTDIIDHQFYETNGIGGKVTTMFNLECNWRKFLVANSLGDSPDYGVQAEHVLNYIVADEESKPIYGEPIPKLKPRRSITRDV